MNEGKGKKVKIPLLFEYSATKGKLLTFGDKLTFLVWNVKWDKSREYRNDENLIKPENSWPYG